MTATVRVVNYEDNNGGNHYLGMAAKVSEPPKPDDAPVISIFFIMLILKF